MSNWSADVISFLNRGEKLFHTSGTEGRYVCIDKVSANAGTFENCYDGITSGMFEEKEKAVLSGKESMLEILDRLRLSDADKLQIVMADTAMTAEAKRFTASRAR